MCHREVSLGGLVLNLFEYKAHGALVLAASLILSGACATALAETPGRSITVQVISSTPQAPVSASAASKVTTVPLNKPASKPTTTAAAKPIVKATASAKPAIKPVVAKSPIKPTPTKITKTVPTKPQVQATKPGSVVKAVVKPAAKPVVSTTKPALAKPIAVLGPNTPTELKGTVLMLQPANKPQPAMKEPPAAFLASDDAMLIRSIPLVISGYAGAAGIPEAAKTPEGVISVLEATSSLLPHMEVIRQAHTCAGQSPEAKLTLLTSLKDRYLKDQDNPAKFFDYGYAQLVLEGNKNGLFFLRKANDRLNTPATSLAYGMAQIDVDRLHEKGQPSELTTRKMDAGYKLKDALILNRVQKMPGIWPTYVQIMASLKDFTAFESLRNEDVSSIYVPAGNTSLSRSLPSAASAFLAMPTAQADTEVPATMSSGVIAPCKASYSTPTQAALAYTKKVDILNNGELSTVNFYKSQTDSLYLVQVQDAKNKVVGEFTSYKAPYIMEDLDGDNQFELVVRQFEREPLHPVYVYRWSGACFGEDTGISAYFK